MSRSRGSGGEVANSKGTRTWVSFLVVIAPVALTVILLGMLVDSLCRKDL